MTPFVVINDEFLCLNCGEFNPKAEQTCRNHCRKCLFSLHIDDKSPGDRKSKCFGMMEPVKVDHDGKKGWMITHKCQKCKKTISNKSLPDDDFDLIIKISQQNEPPRKPKTRK